jgi:hypothetical protein
VPAHLPYDLLVYLLAIQAIAFLYMRQGSSGDEQLGVYIVLILLAVFGVVWGGYATDAAKYLIAFDKDPLRQKEEWLFWVVGHGLNRLVPDPWPLKILTALAIAFYGAAVLRNYRSEPQWRPMLALLLVTLLPFFYFTFFNVVRQGLAGAVIVFGITELKHGRYGRYAAIATISFLLHQTSIVLALVLLLAKPFERYRRVALLAGPPAGFLMYVILKIAGVNLDDYVRYSGRHEGLFHYAKFGVTYAMAWLLIFLPAAQHEHVRTIATPYVFLVAAASLVLRYEVPFERLLLYSELLLPFILPRLVAGEMLTRRNLVIGGMSTAGIGVLLWTHPSLLRSLGYA